MTEQEQFINKYCRNVGNIKIRCDDCKFVEDCVDYGWEGCKKFTQKASGPMTNEEWLNGLSTTEKSEFMVKMVTDAIKEHGEHGVTRCESVIWWDEWLKQPHSEVGK